MAKFNFFVIFLFVFYIAFLFCSTKSTDLDEIEYEFCEHSIWDKPSNIAPNEARIDLFLPFVKGIGGGYVGVGGLQNLIIASWAKSEWICIIDCTKRIVALNFLQREFLKAAPNFTQFRELWKSNKKREAHSIIAHMHKPQYLNVEYCIQTWEMGLEYINRYFAVIDEHSQKFYFKTCFNDQLLYETIRKKALDGKIEILACKLEGEKVFAHSTQRTKLYASTIKVIYLSNVEEYFVEYPLQFRKNMALIPCDEKSVVLRTISFYRLAYPWAEFSEKLNNRGFHYNVMPLKLFLEKLKYISIKNVFQIIKDAHRIQKAGVSVLY